MPGHAAHRRWHRRPDAREPEVRRLLMERKAPFEVAKLASCSIETVYRIRSELIEAGEALPFIRRGKGARNNVYDGSFEDSEDDLSGDRCPRCGLRLPCNGCLPTLDEMALARVSGPAGQAYVGGRISEGGSRRGGKAL